MRALLAAIALVVGAAIAAIPAAPPEVPLSPADVLLLCHEDLFSVNADTKAPVIDPEKAKTTRWISLHNLLPEERDEVAKVMSGHVNSLSREPDITAPVRVGKHLLRIDTLDYGKTFAEQWEKLGKVDPYWHDFDEQPTGEVAADEYEEVEVEYGYWTDAAGQFYTGKRRTATDKWTTTRTVKEKRKKAVVAAKTLKVKGFAYWTQNERSKEAFQALQAKLGGTDAPVVTAEWLLYQTAVQQDRSPGYCDFLGYKDLKEFQKLTGVILDKSVLDESFLKELREAVGNSTVTTPQTLRRIVHLEKAGGNYWITQDADQRAAKNRAKANPITNLGDDYEFDASEVFSHLSNGLFATGLFDAKEGARQNTAPPNIASDSTAPYTDRQVHVNLSCVRCHSNGGMKDIDGWIRNVQNMPPNALGTTDPKQRKTLQQQYVRRRLEPFLDASRDRYNRALLEATGMKSEAYSLAYAKLWEAYAERPVTVERAARDLGCSVKQLQDAIERAGEKREPMLAAFRLPKPATIPVVEWHRVYRRAQDHVHGVARPFAIKEKAK